MASMFEEIFPIADERQRRLLAAARADMLGHGGMAAVTTASGLSAKTVQRGRAELDGDMVITGRVRASGAGRPLLENSQPGLVEALDALVEPFSRGDPMSPLRWTTKSTRNLADELRAQGFTVSHATVAKLLAAMGYSLQANVKTENGKQHPDRDAQFQYIAAQATEFQEAGEPVISIDTKKKELVGNYANGGREWEKKGDPVRANDHDFPDPKVPKAVPFGVYDVTDNAGWVTVGTSSDTAEFAVETIGQWWRKMGSERYPDATRLLITADAGGSNSYRTRLWKAKIAEFALETGIDVTVCHYPPGTSKWNKIEHRLFSHITMNWRGRPLESHEVVVNLIAATTTRTGLRVQAELSEKEYETGVKVTDAEMKDLPIVKHAFHGEWNYTMKVSDGE